MTEQNQNQKPKISGEDVIFLMQAAMATAYGQDAMAKFLLDRANIDRLLAIRDALGVEAFDAEIVKLKDTMSDIGRSVMREKL